MQNPRAAMVFLAIGSLAFTGSVGADTVKKIEKGADFHGMHILDSFDGETSGPVAAKPLTHIVGPFDSDAVVLIHWGGEVAYYPAGGSKAQPLEARPLVQLSRDGFVTHARREKFATASRVSTRVRDRDRIFLKKGEATAIAIETRDEGDASPEKSMAIARLEITAIASPH